MRHLVLTAQKGRREELQYFLLVTRKARLTRAPTSRSRRLSGGSAAQLAAQFASAYLETQRREPEERGAPAECASFEAAPRQKERKKEREGRIAEGTVEKEEKETCVNAQGGQTPSRPRCCWRSNCRDGCNFRRSPCIPQTRKTAKSMTKRIE